jgi:hypothetical protein
MKLINTKFTERQFIARLEKFCRSKNHLYTDNNFETFVYKIQDNQFWLGKYTLVGRSYGFLSTRLNCKYKVTESGRVDVSFRRAKHPFHAILHLLFLVVGIYSCADSLINVFQQSNSSDLFIVLGFLAVGVYGLIIKPSIEWGYLEEHLYKICDIK